MVSVAECGQKAVDWFLEADDEKVERYYLYKVNQGFKKSERLKKALSFKRLFKEGRYFRNRDFSLRVLENNLAVSRLGISIQSKIFPKATQRNRIKRLIREIFRRNKHRFNKGCDIIIRPKDLNLIILGYNQVEKKLVELFKGAGVLKQG